MRPRHVPLRTCVACKTKGPQAGFVRVTRLPDSDLISSAAGKTGGRGAYLCRRLECVETGLERGGLERALGGPGSERSRADLMAWARVEFAAASPS
ncbi:MAG: YlxR family protein [Chloroflexi bacterium]|nr:YlxR family protein [Chloroflexota bacterium]